MQDIMLKHPIRPILAMGADSAGSFCFTDGNKCRLSEAFGELTFAENFENYKKSIEESLRNFSPEIIACDMHPEFLSASLAQSLAQKYKAKLVRVQHHKAHVASVAAEHGLKQYIGIACDGLGYGDDGRLWGGEVFLARGSKIERIGHLEEQAMIGGDSAVIYPEKMLFGILSKFMIKHELKGYFGEKEIALLSRQKELGYNVFNTTSTGRVLDAVSALLGVCKKRTYEGEPAIKLEKFASPKYYNLKPKIHNKKGILILDTTELFRFLIRNFEKDKRKLAASAQLYIAEGLYSIASDHNKKMPIVFCGGVARNKIFSAYMKDKGVLLNKVAPCGDAGIPLGQVYLSAQN